VVGDVLDGPDVMTLTRFASEQSVALTRFAYVLTGDRQLAEDLVQEALLAMHRRFGETIALEHCLAYARRVIVNRHISQGRRSASTETVTSTLPDQPVPPVDLTETDAMWRRLAGLAHRQRAVLVLRYYLDLPDAEIARVLRCRVGTVRSLAARAFAVLRVDPTFALDGAREQR
jgi:RNA polymerase sigma-70 factor (sigma-E family)